MNMNPTKLCVAALLALATHVASADSVAHSWPLLPQFKGMTIENQCGAHGRRKDDKFCAGAPGHFPPPSPSRGGYADPGAEYLYFYARDKCAALPKADILDEKMNLMNCQTNEKDYKALTGK